MNISFMLWRWDMCRFFLPLVVSAVMALPSFAAAYDGCCGVSACNTCTACTSCCTTTYKRVVQCVPVTTYKRVCCRDACGCPVVKCVPVTTYVRKAVCVPVTCCKPVCQTCATPCCDTCATTACCDPCTTAARPRLLGRLR